MKRILQTFCFVISLLIFSFSFAGCSRQKDFFVEYYMFDECIGREYFNSGEKIQKLISPQSDEYELMGWFDSVTGEEIVIGSAITSDMVAIAHTAKTITKTSSKWLSEPVLSDAKKHYKISIVTDAVNVLSIEDFSLIGTIGCAEINFSNAHVSEGRLPDSAFAQNESLCSVVLPASLVSIGELAFSNCNLLASVYFGGALKTIEREAFLGCVAIESLTLPASLQNIDSRAFAGCEKLSALALGNALVNLSADFVDGCKNLSSIKVADSSEKFFSHDGILYRVDYGVSGGSDTITYILLRCPEGRSGEVRMYERTSIIAEKSFSDCKKVSKVVLSSRDETRGNEIQTSAFEGCINLDEVVFSPSLAKIGDRAFFGCEFLRVCEFSLSNELTSIGDFAFFNCDRLASISLPDSIASIGRSAFYSCDNLSSVRLGVTTTKATLSIGEYAFFKNVYYTNMTIFVVGQTSPIALGYLCFGKALPQTESGGSFVNPNRVRFFVPSISVSLYIYRYSESYINFENIVHAG